MRVGIDLASTAGQKSGLGFYTDSMVTALTHFSDIELVTLDRIHRNLRTPERILWDQIGIPLAFLTKHIDVLYTTAFSAPVFHKPVVMTVHDIYGVHYPERFSKLARYYWRTVLPRSIKRASHIIAISEYTKHDLITQLGISEKKITVAPPATDPRFKPIRDARLCADTLKRLHIDNPFLLTVGTLEPRKNIARLIEAFAHAKRQDHILVIVGKKGWDYEDIFRTIDKYHLKDHVRILEYVTQEDLIVLYNTCTGVMLPSIFEGFGLPALEAMQCGAAVAVSHTTSLPEVVGEAGLQFDPLNIQEMRIRMEILINDDAARTELQHKALKTAATFSWERSSASVHTILKSVFERNA
ncbi:MAG: glycosyltransferase family 4 protein [Candidatus Kerfeldbacteria bacterium]|nr:glycosyltransferase family 4 protein [Candidatus Kerfeldbacteria bacterium]